MLRQTERDSMNLRKQHKLIYKLLRAMKTSINYQLSEQCICTGPLKSELKAIYNSTVETINHY